MRAWLLVLVAAVLVAAASIVAGGALAAVGTTSGTVLASPLQTHACLTHAGLHTTYQSAAESSGALGDLLVQFSPDEHAQLSFERKYVQARKDARTANDESRILNLYAGTYTIRNVVVIWKSKPSLAEKSAVRVCIKP